MKTKDVSVSTIKKQRINRSLEQWRDLVWQQRRSGLNLEAFCRRASASTTVFGRWRKHFREAPEPVTKAKALASKAVSRKRDAVTAGEPLPTFVEIASSMRPLDTGVRVRLELGGGIVLERVRA